MKYKRRIIFRMFPSNRLTLPLLLNIWEKQGLDKHFEIKIVGAQNIEPLHIKKDDIREDDVFVYSFMTPHVPQVGEEIAQIIGNQGKARLPLLVAGGPHVSGNFEMAAALGFQVLFQGAGEETMVRFAFDLLARSSFRDRTVYRETGREDFSLQMPVSTYFRNIPPLEIMRGCFWNCRYCQTGSQTPRFRPLSSIAWYLEELRRRRFKRVNFISPSSLEYAAEQPRTSNLEKLGECLELCHSLGFRFIEYGIFPSETRPDTVTDEALKLLKKYVSNRRLTMGGQSGLDQRLGKIGRGHSVGDIRRAVATANRHGFLVNLDLIVGFPDETADERRQTFEFIRELSQKQRVRVHLHQFFPLAGSDLQWRFPTFLSQEERETLLQLRKSGLATDWWIDGEQRAKYYFQWLKKNLPSFYAKYN